MSVSYEVFRFFAAVLRPCASTFLAKLACFCALGPYSPLAPAAIFPGGIGLSAGTPSDWCRPPGLNSIGFLPAAEIFVFAGVLAAVLFIGLDLLPLLTMSTSRVVSGRLVQRASQHESQHPRRDVAEPAVIAEHLKPVLAVAPVRELATDHVARRADVAAQARCRDVQAMGNQRRIVQRRVGRADL